MIEDNLFEPPQITDPDIEWVSTLLGLEENAFYGDDGTDPRQDVLKCMGSLDVAACPGSGKTTLLVAKLAVLAEKWRYRTRGICVLSHTNIARHEIETKIGGTDAGRRLLSYPHYIGTIHGFVNEFLALPWLRSKGIPIRIIDDDEVEKRRRYLIEKLPKYAALKSFVDNNEVRQNLVKQWVVSSPDFDVLKENGEPVFKNACKSADQLIALVETVIRNGYHRHNEMFTWAKDLMNSLPEVLDVIRDRFPFLLIDEAQDNSEEQSAILHRIFMEGPKAVICQRFGDENQAIFNSTDSVGVTSDEYKFPTLSIMKLPNSHRFGAKIADFAGPLGLAPYVEGLKGQGPSKKMLVTGVTEGPHTIFLFDSGKVSQLLNAYGELLINTFPEEKLREGKFWAVGQVHKPNDQTEDRKMPHFIGHYWPEYDPEMAGLDPRPRTFAQHVFVGLEKAKTTGETHLAVENISEGILRLVKMAEGGNPLLPRRYNHRYILELLKGRDDIQSQYQELLERFIVKAEPVTKNAWNDQSCGIRQSVQKIAEAIAGESLSSRDEEFIKWAEGLNGQSLPIAAQKSRSNIYQYPNDDPKVQIRVGSIHSVKGMTHTATLVMETFWQDRKGRHNLELLLSWLDGSKSGGLKEGVHQKSRLKLHYVAMTRPTHLLCLAMKQSCISNDCLQRLERRGWQIKTI